MTPAGTPGKIISPRAGYDVVDERQSKKRRRACIEVKGEECQLDRVKRLNAVNLCRDLERNYSAARGHMRQFKTNVVGVGPKLALNLKDEASAAAAKWINGTWAKHCDSRGDTPLAEIVANVLTAKKREGDILVVFDDFDEDDGKLLFFEADQLVEMKSDDWERCAPKYCCDKKTGKAMCQEQGVVFDRRGRVVAYIATHCHGRMVCDADECTVFPVSSARLMLEPWRLNQRRGAADMITPAAHYLDSYEMLSSELQSAKLQSKMGAKVTKTDGAEAALLENGVDVEGLVSQTTASGTEAIGTGTTPAANYESIEALCGGYVDYLNEGEDIVPYDIKRPNVAMKDFLDFISDASGASMGLAAVYSSLRASTSYTAFRGEMLLSWAQFLWDQKWIERRFLDWVVPKAIEWAVRKGLLVALPVGWESEASYIWPTMPEVDRTAAATADGLELKNGTTDYAKLLGPGWREKFAALAEQIEVARELDLPLSIMQTVAGAPIPANGTTPAPAEEGNQGSEEQAQPAPPNPKRASGFLSRLKQLWQGEL